MAQDRFDGRPAQQLLGLVPEGFQPRAVTSAATGLSLVLRCNMLIMRGFSPFTARCQAVQALP